MSRRTALAALAILCLSASTLLAQTKQTKQAEKKLSEILKEFDDDLKEYGKELKHFEKVSDFDSLNDTRKELVEQATKMSDLEKAGKGSGPSILALAKEMKTNAETLDKGTTKLESHAKKVAGKADKAAATTLRKKADSVTKAIDKVIEMFD